MKTINSKDLYDYVNELEFGKSVMFNVYRGNSYITHICWDGNDFCWESGTFSSGAFFSDEYFFEIIEEDNEIEKITLDEWAEITTEGDLIYKRMEHIFNKNSNLFVNKINKLIDEVNKLKHDTK